MSIPTPEAGIPSVDVPHIEPAAYEAAIEAIDAANAEDPVTHGGEPLALVQGVLAHQWVAHLDPEASAPLLIAARAHHLRRWVVPRSSYPVGRGGYLRWRRDQKVRHARELTELLRELGIDSASTERAAAIVAKEGLDRGTDAEVQTFEDAAALTFMETQFASTADRVDDDRMIVVIRKTMAKMTPAGQTAARTIELHPRLESLVARAST